MGTLHVILVILHIMFAAGWMGLAIRLSPLARRVAGLDGAAREALAEEGSATVRSMTGAVVLFFVFAVANMMVGGGFAGYPPVYHTSGLLGLILVLLQVLMIRPAWKRLAGGDNGARSRVVIPTEIGKTLWLVMLVLMFFGSRWGSAWGF